MAEPFAGKISSGAFDSHYLFVIRELKVSFEFSAGPDSAGFDPTVPFVHRFMLRGEKPPSGEV
jgi:hypothetical protein